MIARQEIPESKSSDREDSLTNAGKENGEGEAAGQRTVTTQTSEELTGIPPGIRSEVPKRVRRPSVKKKPIALSAGELIDLLIFKCAFNLFLFSLALQLELIFGLHIDLQIKKHICGRNLENFVR